MRGPVVQFSLNPILGDPRVRKTARAARDAGYPVAYVGVHRDPERHQHGPLVPTEPLDECSHYLADQSIVLPYDELLGILNRANPLFEAHPRVLSSLYAAWDDPTEPLSDRLKAAGLAPAYGALLGLNRSGLLKIAPRTMRTARRYRAMWAIFDLRPQLIHAHDLMSFRIIAPFAKVRGVPVIYDSHELERGRNTPTWSPAKRKRHALSERVTIPLARRVITVAESIADVLAEAYGITRPAVTMNSPPKANIRPNRRLAERLDLPRGSKVILYLGGITFGRGLPSLLEVFGGLPENIHLVTLGPIGSSFEARWQQVLGGLSDALRTRVHVLDRVPYQEVIHRAYGADLGYNGIEHRCESYRHALPNKFFEYVFSDIPVVSTPTPDVARFSQQYGLGTTYPDADADALLEVLRSALCRDEPLRIPEAQRRDFIDHVCWESQAEIVAQVYREILGEPQA